MVTLLQASQLAVSNGGFCAIVAASLYVYDYGEVILQKFGRALKPIYFSDKKPEMLKKAEEIFRQETDVHLGAQSSQEREEFWFHVKTSILECSPSVLAWDSILESSPTRVAPRETFYAKPKVISYDDVFQLAARDVFEKQESTTLTKELLEEVVDDLHGSVVLETTGGGVIQRWQGQQGKLALPAWRLLQFRRDGTNHLFSWVQDWVVIETRKLFYVVGPDEYQKTWELATMAVL